MKKNYLGLIFLILIMALIIGGGVLSAEESKQKESSAGENKVSAEKKDQTKKVERLPSVFVPAEKVSADQAVAFPTDI